MIAIEMRFVGGAVAGRGSDGMVGVWDGRTDGWMGGWTDPRVVQAQEVQEQVGVVVVEQAKKWQLPCKFVWIWAWLLLWFWLMLKFNASLMRRAAVEVAFLFTPFLVGKQHSRLQDAFLWGQLQGGGRTPLSPSPLACSWLA